MTAWRRFLAWFLPQGEAGYQLYVMAEYVYNGMNIQYQITERNVKNMEPGILVISFFGVVLLLAFIFGILHDVEAEDRVATEASVKLSEHLKQLGIKTSVLELDKEQQQILFGYNTGSKSIVEIKDSDIGYAFVRAEIREHPLTGTDYWSSFIVKNTFPFPQNSYKSTVFPIMGVEWTGDKSLSKVLNEDANLKKEYLTGLPWIISAKPQYGCYNITINRAYPDRKTFAALETIVKHLKNRA